MAVVANILWVDDQAHGIQPFVDVFELMKYSVTVCRNATDGLRELHRCPNSYDVIIIDVMLPAGDLQDLFLDCDTDDGLSTGLVLFDVLIRGYESEFLPLAGIPERLVVFSGAAMNNITDKIRQVEHEHNIKYVAKGEINDPNEFVNLISTLFQIQRG